MMGLGLIALVASQVQILPLPSFQNELTRNPLLYAVVSEWLRSKTANLVDAYVRASSNLVHCVFHILFFFYNS